MRPVARREELVIQEIGGELLIYDLRTNKAFCLNQTSALIWQNCDGEKSALEIASEIEKQLGSSVNEDFIWLALSQFEKDNLLSNQEKLPSQFDGLSRREIIKKIGLTSVIALPIVASLVAPLAVEGGSLLAPGTPCSDDSQCQSGRCRNPGCNPSGASRVCRNPGDCP